MDRSNRVLLPVLVLFLVSGCYHYLPETEEPVGPDSRVYPVERSRHVAPADPMPVETGSANLETPRAAAPGNDLEDRIGKIEKRLDDIEGIARDLFRDESAVEGCAGPETEGERIMDEAKAAFLDGDLEGAVGLFERVMLLKPSHEEAVRLRDRVGIEFLVEVLSKGGKFKYFAEWLLERASSDEAEEY